MHYLSQKCSLQQETCFAKVNHSVFWSGSTATLWSKILPRSCCADNWRNKPRI